MVISHIKRLFKKKGRSSSMPKKKKAIKKKAKTKKATKKKAVRKKK